MDSSYKLQNGDVYAWRDIGTEEIHVDVFVANRKGNSGKVEEQILITNDNVKLIKTADDIKYMFPKILSAEEQAEQDEKDTSIPVNIWDDFWDDGCVPKGHTQNTFAYVESEDFTLTIQKKTMELLCAIIKESKILDESLYHIQTKTYENHWINNGEPYKRCKLIFKKITHKQLDKLMKILENNKYFVDNIPVRFYSES